MSRGDAVDVLGLGGGDDAVDHGAREGALGGDPVGEGGIDQAAELEHDAAGHGAVVGEVVAGEHGEGSGAGGAAAVEGADEEARGRARRGRVREVVDDVGMGAVEAAGGRVVAVALLGDGQADDADGWVGHAGDDGLGVLEGDEHVLDHVDDLRGLAVGAELEGGVGEALRREAVALVGADEADADDAPVAAGGAHRLGDVEGAVGAEEGAEAEVDDADAGARAGRAGQARGVSGQAGLRRWGRPLAAHRARRCARVSCWAQACSPAPAGRSPPPHPRHCSQGFLMQKGAMEADARKTSKVRGRAGGQRASQPPSTGRMVPWM